MLYAVGSGSEVCVFGESVGEGRKRREERKEKTGGGGGGGKREGSLGKMYC
jgi:hypothetical protein